METTLCPGCHKYLPVTNGVIDSHTKYVKKNASTFLPETCSGAVDNTRQLIRILQAIHALPDADVPKHTGPRGFPTYIGKIDPKDPTLQLPANEQPELIDWVETLACVALIDDKGQPNFTEIQRVKNAGFHVQAGEMDSFGWLTGMIKIPAHGFLVYG